MNLLLGVMKSKQDLGLHSGIFMLTRPKVEGACQLHSRFWVNELCGIHILNSGYFGCQNIIYLRICFFFNNSEDSFRNRNEYKGKGHR
jgi:hypothetical protein